MRIGGLHKFSLIDYPGKTAAVLFTLGCNFRCPYCHNPELVNPKNPLAEIPWTDVHRFLKSRQGLLEGVVLTGGEPTLQLDLIDIVKQIKELGFPVKLDTNGSRPEVIEKLLQEKLLEYIAMDVKGPLERYQDFTDTAVDVAKIQESISLIMDSGTEYEFRTTVVPRLHHEDDVRTIAKAIKGAKRYVLQNFSQRGCLDPKFRESDGFSSEQMARFQAIAQNEVKSCLVR